MTDAIAAVTGSATRSTSMLECPLSPSPRSSDSHSASARSGARPKRLGSSSAKDRRSLAERAIAPALKSPRSSAARPADARWSEARTRESRKRWIRRIELRRDSDAPARGGNRRSRRSRRGRGVREPVGEALVQLGARRLGQRLVGGIADEQMAEAESLVLRERRASSSGSAPCGRASRGAPRRSRPHRIRATAPRRRRGGRPRPRPTPRSITTRTSPSSESMRACRSAWIVGGTTISPSPPCSRTIASISSTKSGFPAEAAVIRSRKSPSSGASAEQVAP